jgi:hypothetical protein
VRDLTGLERGASEAVTTSPAPSFGYQLHEVFWGFFCVYIDYFSMDGRCNANLPTIYIVKRLGYRGPSSTCICFSFSKESLHFSCLTFLLYSAILFTFFFRYLTVLHLQLRTCKSIVPRFKVQMRQRFFPALVLRDLACKFDMISIWKFAGQLLVFWLPLIFVPISVNLDVECMFIVYFAVKPKWCMLRRCRQVAFLDSRRSPHFNPTHPQSCSSASHANPSAPNPSSPPSSPASHFHLSTSYFRLQGDSTPHVVVSQIQAL